MLKIYKPIKFILFVVGSYFLVHILGIFGIFLVVAYPIWCLVSIRKVPCFYCGTKKTGEVCPACKLSVGESRRYPKTVRSVLLNTLSIFIVFLLSLGTVALEARALRALGFYQVAKTVSFAIPTKGVYRLGEVFPMEITLADVKTPINTVQADLGFDPTILEVEAISTEGSFAKIFVQKEIQNETGFARISGGLPNPGVSCTECHFASVIFKTKKPGTAVVEYLPSSVVLANDGRGTSVVKSLGSTAFIVLPEKVDSSQISQQEVYLQTKVLGLETEETENQIHLYKGKVLAENNIDEVDSKKQTFKMSDWFKKILLSLERFDSLVVGFWENVFGF